MNFTFCNSIFEIICRFILRYYYYLYLYYESIHIVLQLSGIDFESNNRIIIWNKLYLLIINKIEFSFREKLNQFTVIIIQ